MTDMIDKLIQLYKKLSIKTRKVIVLVIAFAVAFTTVHLLTFPATAITRSAGLEDPGITVGTEAGDEPADTITEEEFGVRTENQMPEGTGPEALPEEVSEENPTNESGTDELDSAEVSAAPAAAEETVDPASTEEPVNEEDAERDPEADTEDASDWEELFREIEQTGVWADDLIALAETQIGYTESERNFITDEEGRKHGYTRYGAWYGDSYRTWDSLFILFNLHYAGITEQDFPYEADCEDWVESLKEAEMFREVDTYIPGKGDLVFADTDDDGVTDHAAIVRKVVFNLEGRPEELVVVEGDTDNAVRENRYEFYNPLITGFAQLPENPELAEQEPQVFALTGSANRVDVTVLYEEGAFPEGTTMEVKTVGNRNVITAINETVSEENKEVVRVQAVDIIFRDTEGTEIEPRKPIRVTMKSRSVPQAATEKPVVVHVDDNAGPAVIETSTPEDEPEDTREAVTFEAGSFSIYAIVYTVDFHWEVNGKMYEFNLPGGGYVSFQNLIEVLGISQTTYGSGNQGENASDNDENEAVSSEDGDNESINLAEEVPVIIDQDETDENSSMALALDGVEVSDVTRKFVADVESVVFSSPELVDISKVESETTVGGIKESRGLEVQYSADLTEEQIAEINGMVVESGDWALISMLPFESEETLIVTMKNGDAFEIRVTDVQIKKTVIDARGDTWEITVTYNDEAEIPEDAELRVREILPEDEEYEEYYQRSLEKVGVVAVPDTTEDEQASEVNDEDTAAETTSEENSVSTYAHIFDIQIWDDDHEIQPAADVSVSIKLLDAPEEDTDLRVVHFSKDGLEEMELTGDGEETGEQAEGVELCFVTNEFSVYSIVTGPSGAEAGWEKLTSLDALTTKGYYIGHTSGYYLTSTEVSKTSGEDTLSGIKRTSQKAVPTVNGAMLYYFENAPDGKYYIYCMDGENKKYVVNTDASLSFAENENDKTAFTVEVNSSGVFKIHNGDWYWNMQTGSSADGFYAKKKANDGNNNLYLWEQTDPNTDTYGLDGKTYGLMTWTGGNTAKALMAAENNGTGENSVSYPGCLEAKFLTVMTQATNAGNKLYVPNDTSDKATMWTFEWVRNDPNNRLNSYYYLKADDKYLKITANGLSLVDEAEKDESCLIQVKPGTGNKEGQICLKSVGSGSKTLTYSGEYAKGYNVGGTAGSEWLYLVEEKPEDLLANYKKVYTATKVSVSDTEKVNTGAKVIIYARQWKNDHYEYYAINSEGKLVPCSENGDTIEWYGGNVNDMLWQFTEYVYEGTDTPNGYYELENLYAKSKGEPSYLAPKYSDGSILSDKTVGVVLQGRTDQQYYSPIVAWDTPEYMYSALTVDLNKADPKLEPCVRVDGLDFYFAIMEDVPVDDTLHTVPTIDNNQYGIVMKMADLTNGSTNQMPAGSMNAFLQSTTSNGATFIHTPGLLSTDLKEDGYPVTTRANSGGSLGLLYDSSRDYRTVNHLFIESTYSATGYYEYNSAQNFAYLTDDNDFRVYQELGTNDTTSKPTLQHGQFFPYNDIEAGRFASSNPENLYEISGGTTASKPPQLSDSDPRKHEQLYLVKEKTKGEKTDYYFAMELEAGFIQTPSGLDAWGHDIIFEFSGDDDFWLYVDGELVLDLGGIHSAVGGKVNFRTGVVINNGVETTLYDVFKANYMTRGDTEAQALEKVNRLFEQNEAGQWVFKDGTQHTMRIFYMERGAGASNLHMKFNLASVKKGTVELHKELEGADKTETTNAWFPYQVYYRMENETSSDPERMLRNAFDPSEASEDYYSKFGTAASTDYVFYKDKTKPVKFLPELTVDGVKYYNVFMLKPEETAVLNFPVTRPNPDQDEITVGEYRIVECGIDSSVFTEVTVNGEVNNGVQSLDSTNSNLKDYGIDMATTDDRPQVNYVNKVENLKNLTFTKELYRKYDADTGPVKVNPDGSEIGEGDPRPQQYANEETFDFRLLFKTPYDSGFSWARQHIYHVKDPKGYYCRWDSGSGRFERITEEKYPGFLKPGFEDGTTDYDNLTDDIVNADDTVTHLGKFWASFETGNGSISGIPAYYTIEVRGLIPGTQYKIIEQPTETPDGYKFWQYTNNEGVVHTDSDPYDPGNGIDGTIRTDIDAGAVVKNYKGFGLRLEKVWADASSMQDRDPAYFAVYTVNSDGVPVTLVPGSVQRLTYTSDQTKQQLYWWYLDLPIANIGLMDYAVFEVVLTGNGITVGNDNVVSGYDSIDPVQEGGLVALNGKLTGESEPEKIDYTVTYATPVNLSDNVRGFKAINSPAQLPPVRFVKTDWDGNKLPGADFTLQYGENLSNSLFNPPTKTSDEDGLIAQVYLQKDVPYTLTELEAPQGYVGLSEPLTVTLVATTSDGWELNVSPEIPDGYPTYYKVTTENGILTVTVKNRPYDFEAVKVDSTNTDVKVEGAWFDLYKQVVVGSTTTWDENNPVYTNLITDRNGVIPHIDNTLPAGTYQLRETKAPSRYSKLTGNIDFTVSGLGVITLGSHPDGVALTSTTDASGKITYSINIPNTPVPLKLVKQDNNKKNLIGAKFQLTTLNSSDVWEVVKDKDGRNVYDDIDMTSVYEFELSDLPAGRYRLEETHAPDGYLILTKYIYFMIDTNRKVILTDGSNGNHNSQASISQSAGVYIITVKNEPGAALPNTGGPGTRIFTILGSILILGAGVLLLKRRKLI
jgi:fibro-slime domain-containing protein/LPXTG-motif cell wall-anchored protein